MKKSTKVISKRSPKRTSDLIGAAGFVKEYSDAHNILCDFDGDSDLLGGPLRRLASVHTLARYCQAKVVYFRLDKTENGWHAIIRFDRKLPRLAIVACQAILGSDPKREMLNLSRALQPMNRFSMFRWNILFASKLRKSGDAAIGVGFGGGSSSHQRER